MFKKISLLLFCLMIGPVWAQQSPLEITLTNDLANPLRIPVNTKVNISFTIKNNDDSQTLYVESGIGLESLKESGFTLNVQDRCAAARLSPLQSCEIKFELIPLPEAASPDLQSFSFTATARKPDGSTTETNLPATIDIDVPVLLLDKTEIKATRPDQLTTSKVSIKISNDSSKKLNLKLGSMANDEYRYDDFYTEQDLFFNDQARGIMVDIMEDNPNNCFKGGANFSFSLDAESTCDIHFIYVDRQASRPQNHIIRMYLMNESNNKRIPISYTMTTTPPSHGFPEDR